MSGLLLSQNFTRKQRVGLLISLRKSRYQIQISGREKYFFCLRGNLHCAEHRVLRTSLFCIPVVLPATLNRRKNRLSGERQ
jgi:hypothetical protein